MEKQEGTFEQMELKYCERCGGLWLRRQGSGRVFCAACVPKMDELPQPRTRGKARLEAPPLDLDLERRELELFGVAEGGQS